ncbi:MAG: aldo/keto reductase, partial [Chloroflexi bacterium]|nr:aldo/keto reductase [Chloroflexota bacterium]
SVITGATRLKQLEDNLGAADAIELLSDDLLDEIETVLGNEPDS